MKVLALLFLLLSSPTWAADRDPGQVRAFRRVNACPSTKLFTGPCPNYVVDHIIPLATYGPDRPDNMQWSKVDEAKKKDKLEFEAYRAKIAAEKKMKENCKNAGTP